MGLSLSLERALAEVAQKVLEQSAKRQALAKKLRRLRGEVARLLPGVKGVCDPELIISVQNSGLHELEALGVDGGMLSLQLQGLDLILIRAVAVLFRYEGGRLSLAQYYPSGLPPPRLVGITDPLDAHEVEVLAGLERQLEEVGLALEAMEELGPRAVILDGSITPQYVGWGKNTDGIRRRVFNAFKELYQRCASEGVSLVGVVKDSRGSGLSRLLNEEVFPELGLGPQDLEILRRSRDASLLNHLLKPGERSAAFTCGQGRRELGDWGSRIYAFYLKNSPQDEPLRVEFLSPNGGAPELADRVASMVYSLSANGSFKLPSVLIEADVRAGLAEEDLEFIRDRILARVKPMFIPELKRSSMPFG